MAAQPSSSFAIPSISEDDLRAFHRAHFENAPAPDAFFVVPQAVVDQEFDQDVDDLGYYADGVKRTLTDAQIALFRHSEVQRLIHDRRRQREARESELEDGEVDDALHLDHETAASHEQDSAVHEPERASDSKRSTLRERSKKHKGRKNKSDLDRPGRFDQLINKKRKWQEYVVDHDSGSPSPHTHRRIAREMDEIPTRNTSIDLLYGDEEEEATIQSADPMGAGRAVIKEAANVLQESSRRRVMSYED